MPLTSLTPSLPPSSSLSSAPALSAALRSATGIPTGIIYLIAFSSPASPSSWCPDCRAALPALQAVFDRGEARGYFLEVEREEWRVRVDEEEGEGGNKKRHFTRAVLGVGSVPTVLKWDVEAGRELARLPDPVCKDEAKLRAFVAA